jgi:hypothetical protein
MVVSVVRNLIPRSQGLRVGGRIYLLVGVKPSLEMTMSENR